MHICTGFNCCFEPFSLFLNRWPDDLIRWVDMVDLRGKPPYLPESKTYTDVLKSAIENAFSYYGYDP